MRNMALKHGHQKAVMWDDTEGVVSTKFALSIMSVVDNDFGGTVPIAFILHKRKGKVVCQRILDHLGIFVSNSPRHYGWPLPQDPADAPLPPLPPSPHGPAWGAVAGAWQELNSPMRRAPVQPEGPVVAFCPAYIVIDCDPHETEAAESCLWSRGWQGHGLPAAEFAARVIWCTWHLHRAWARQAADRVSNVQVREQLMGSLSKLRKDLVEVRQLSLLRTPPALTPLVQDAASATSIVAGFVNVWRTVEAAKSFMDYFEDYYTGTRHRWLRPQYIARFPEELRKHIPVGTQGAEGLNSSIKMVDLVQLCVHHSSPDRRFSHHLRRKRLSQRKPALVLMLLVDKTQIRFQRKRLAQQYGVEPGRATFVTPVRERAWHAAHAAGAAGPPAEEEEDHGGFGGGLSPAPEASPVPARTPGSARLKRARSEVDAALDQLASLPARLAVNALSRLAAVAQREFAVAQRIEHGAPAARGLFAPPGARVDNGLRRVKSVLEPKGRKGVSANVAFGRVGRRGTGQAVGKAAGRAAGGAAPLPHPRGIVKPPPRARVVKQRKQRRTSAAEAAQGEAAMQAARAVRMLPAELAAGASQQ